MNQRSDIDRVLRVWMDDGPSVMPDRIVDVVADRISDQAQRHSWTLRLRKTAMPVSLAAAIAAAAVLAVAGYNLLPGNSGVGGLDTTPSPSHSAPPVPEGQLEAGRYRFGPFTDLAGWSVVADVPAGWQGVPPAALQGPGGYDGPDGISLGLLRPDGLFGDPCHWDVDGTGSSSQQGDVGVGPRAIDLVDALRSNASYTSTTPSPITLGGFEGYQLDIQFPAEAADALCDLDENGVQWFLVFSGNGNLLYVPGIRDRWRLVIVNVGERRMVVTVPFFEGTPPADLEAAQAIIDSLEFQR